MTARSRPIFRADNFWFWFGGIWLAIGLPFLAIGVAAGWHDFTREWPLRSEGVITYGVVVGKYRQGSPERSRSERFVIYRFAVRDGAAQEGRAEVDEETWNRLEKDRPVRVVFLPQSPNIHRMEGADFHDKLVTAVVFLGLGTILSALGGLVVGRALAMRLAAARIVREGIEVEAEVTGTRPGGSALNGVTQWRLSYRYRDPAGRVHEARSAASDPEQIRRWKNGDRGRIRVDRVDPSLSVWLGN